MLPVTFRPDMSSRAGFTHHRRRPYWSSSTCRRPASPRVDQRGTHSTPPAAAAAPHGDQPREEKGGDRRLFLESARIRPLPPPLFFLAPRDAGAFPLPLSFGSKDTSIPSARRGHKQGMQATSSHICPFRDILRGSLAVWPIWMDGGRVVRGEVPREKHDGIWRNGKRGKENEEK